MRPKDQPRFSWVDRLASRSIIFMLGIGAMLLSLHACSRASAKAEPEIPAPAIQMRLPANKGCASVSVKSHLPRNRAFLTVMMARSESMLHYAHLWFDSFHLPQHQQAGNVMSHQVYPVLPGMALYCLYWSAMAISWHQGRCCLKCHRQDETSGLTAMSKTVWCANTLGPHGHLQREACSAIRKPAMDKGREKFSGVGLRVTRTIQAGRNNKDNPPGI